MLNHPSNERRAMERYMKKSCQITTLRYLTKGSQMRKWKMASYSPSPTMLCLILFMISTYNMCLCTAREIRISGPGKRVLASGSSGSSANPNNATSSNASKISDLTWTIERKDCGQLDDGCFCENRLRNWTTVRCKCDDNTQIAHVKPPGLGREIKLSSLFVQRERWTWKFEQCSQLVLHSKILGAVDGSHFQVEFRNISTLTVHESAFETRGSYNSHGNQNQVSILFSQCNMDRLPTKTFPSYVHSIRLTECNIKTLGPRFIQALKMDKVTIESSNIHDIEPEAFYSQTIIDTVNVDNSTIVKIHANGIASGISKMLWMNSKVGILQEDALSGDVATITIENSEFSKLESSGFSLKSWSKVILANNTFKYVARRGIDLSLYSDDNPSVEIRDNSWVKVERDFITTGSGESSFIRIRSNTFLQECECGNTFSSYLTMNGSRSWFHDELLGNSKCPVVEQVLSCMLLNGHINSTDSNLLSNDSLSLLCDPQVYMCVNGVSEVEVSSEESIPGRPQLPNRLRVLAYFIAAMGMFIIASLLITMCVFLCRRKTPKKKSPSDSPLQDLENAQGKKSVMSKSLSGGEYADIVFKHQNASARPRSMLFEDVEMEDKGVQTMPTELSSEVLEGLREKLSKPDSFWDAKETIDHLYDLIQVKELNAELASPPDVTMNSHSTTASTARLLPSTSSSPVAHVISEGVSVSIGTSDSQLQPNSNDSSPSRNTPPPLPATSPPSGVPHIQRYAQIKNKPKTAPLCEYADPSDSSMHIYSELTPHTTPDRTKSSTSSSNGNIPTPPTHPSQSRESPSKKSNLLQAIANSLHNGPILCEYTEPKDVQPHVYAELSNNTTPQKQGSKSVSSSPVRANSVKSGLLKQQPFSITIAVPPPPISIPQSNSFHCSPRLLGKLKENELSCSNPSLTTNTASPVKIIHVNDSATHDSKHRLASDKLRRSTSNVVDGGSPARSSTMVSSVLSDKTAGNGSANGNDTQKRPLPSIPSWPPNKNEAKSQL